jgi:hypothetical protein
METEEKIFGCLVGGFILSILIVIIFSIFFSFFTPTEGSHTGYITAVEKNGVIWKTGRAYVKTDLSSSQEDMYCVKDQRIYDELVKAQINKEKITIKFNAPLIVPNWDCGGENAIIYDINF